MGQRDTGPLNSSLNPQRFLVKLFAKSFEERRLPEKRRHPKTLCCSETGFRNTRQGTGDQGAGCMP
ncbi:hypothetical protein NJLHNGOC_06685 [Novacetimonas cocois]|uniref:Uncharacterized protein n=1 Tax=Novacetimonas cocois TaxID=1747507 RepID=A0A365YX70_9PROT|nr:hypothetical protein NJLHNGOC_06685 [Novacetimonas cocois]